MGGLIIIFERKRVRGSILMYDTHILEAFVFIKIYFWKIKFKKVPRFF